MPKNLIAFEFAEWILRSLRFGALERSKGAFCCCKCLFIYFLLECRFDARTCDVNFLSVGRFGGV